jgi:hypothetical protein
MRNFVFFKDSKVFNKNKIWRLEQVKLKFPVNESEQVLASIIELKSEKKTLQTGLVINAKNEGDAIEKYIKIQEFLNG